MSMHQTYGLLFAILLCFGLQAQKPEKWIKLGDEAFAQNDHYAAFSYYQRAIAQDSSKAEYQYKYAESARLINNYDIAARFYEKVYTKERGRFYPDGVVHLANMKEHSGLYKDAGKYWRKAKSKRKKGSYIYKKAIQEYKSSQWAKLEQDNFLPNAWVKPLPSPVNSKLSEFAAVPLKDSLMFYSALVQKSTPSGKVIEGQKGVQIYASKYDIEENRWEQRRHASKSFSDIGSDLGNGSFDAVNERYYFSVCDGPECDIYFSKVIDGELFKPEILNVNINGKGAKNTQPFYIKDGEKELLFFASDREGGEGKLDIWMSERSGSDWGEAENLGNMINTPDDELTPYYAPDQNRIYFSSTWHFGFGGHDVFYSEKDSEGNYMLPKNMGQPINTPANDLYFCMSGNDHGFLTSNRDGSNPWSKGTCCNDIYSFNIDPVILVPEDNLPVITDIGDLGVYLPISLYFHNDEPDPNTTDTITKLNYLTSYEAYKKRIPTYRKKYTEDIPFELIIPSDSTIIDFFENKAQAGVDKLELVSKLLLRELEQGARIDLAIKGYASPLAQSDYNKNLTLRRIHSLINYFNEYEDGAFITYMNDVAPSGGYLGIEKIPFGESKASRTVSDNVNDQRNSIYSKAAAMERKIEILAIEKSDKAVEVIPEEVEKTLSFTEEEKDLGRIKRGKLLTHVFSFENTLDKKVRIDHVQPACGCTLVGFPTRMIYPGKKGEIPIEIDTKELSKGLNTKSILVIANDGEIVQELKVSFIVE
ncbi:MAG: DUF1573 domain-containing protein [Flavobacteriales bacterium]|nr:DUF1573 domain-containing protein [Flavobacteriales bacterium]